MGKLYALFNAEELEELKARLKGYLLENKSFAIKLADGTTFRYYDYRNIALNQYAIVCCYSQTSAEVLHQKLFDVIHHIKTLIELHTLAYMQVEEIKGWC